jgi:5,10-methylenetetrahydromethanopterin reductase
MKENWSEPTIGVHFNDYLPIKEALSLSKIIDNSAVKVLWASDDGPIPPLGETYVILTAIALNTRRVELGTAVLTPYTRHPALMTRAALAIQNIAGRKLRLGIATGGPSVLRRMNIKVWDQPLTTMRESITIMRKLISGRKIANYEGSSMRIRNTVFEAKDADISIYLGARGNRMLKLAGEVADGVNLTSPVSHIKEAVKMIRQGRKETKRLGSEFHVCNYIPTSIGHNRREAMNEAKWNTAELVAYNPEAMVLGAGITNNERNRVRQAMLARDEESLRKMITDDMINAFSASGTVEDCIRKVRLHIEAGVDHPILAFPLGPNRRTAIELIAEHIAPAFR